MQREKTIFWPQEQTVCCIFPIPRQEMFIPCSAEVICLNATEEQSPGFDLSKLLRWQFLHCAATGDAETERTDSIQTPTL